MRSWSCWIPWILSLRALCSPCAPLARVGKTSATSVEVNSVFWFVLIFPLAVLLWCAERKFAVVCGSHSILFAVSFSFQARKPSPLWPWCLRCITTNPLRCMSWMRSMPRWTSKMCPLWPTTSKTAPRMRSSSSSPSGKELLLFAVLSVLFFYL